MYILISYIIQLINITIHVIEQPKRKIEMEKVFTNYYTPNWSEKVFAIKKRQ